MQQAMAAVVWAILAARRCPICRRFRADIGGGRPAHLAEAAASRAALPCSWRPLFGSKKRVGKHLALMVQRGPAARLLCALRRPPRGDSAAAGTAAGPGRCAELPPCVCPGLPTALAAVPGLSLPTSLQLAAGAGPPPHSCPCLIICLQVGCSFRKCGVGRAPPSWRHQPQPELAACARRPVQLGGARQHGAALCCGGVAGQAAAGAAYPSAHLAGHKHQEEHDASNCSRRVAGSDHAVQVRLGAAPVQATSHQAGAHGCI